MEGNVLSLNHLDENVLPPPRKRLLAGLKKQSENSSDHLHSAMSVFPSATTPEVACAKNLLIYHLSGGSSLSLQAIAESSNKAAISAVKAAEAARAVAEEKAAVAAKAIVAAKSALKLVEVFSDRGSDIDRHTKRNMSKKQGAVHSLYKKCDEVGSGKTNETEQKSHQTVYTPPSIFIHSQTSADSKTHKHKKSKVSSVVEKSELPNDESREGNSLAMCNGKTTLDTECYSLTKLISSNWRVEKDIVSRKQLSRMVES